MKKKIAADLVVVGSGIAGLSAALEARRLGARVVVLEKLKAARGNTYYAGGGSLFKISAPPQAVVAEAARTGKGRVDLGLVRTFARHVNEGIDWLKSLGLEWFEPARSMPVSGREGTCVAEDSLGKTRVKGYGRAICRTLASAAVNNGIELFFQTRAEKILRDAQGRITGIRAGQKGSAFEIKANRVVLATGGFQGNKEMVKKFLAAPVSKAKFSGSPFNTGDGHLMALELGAQMVHTDQWHASLRNKHRVNPYPRLQYGSILVNSRGLRFVDEIRNTKDFIAKEMVKQPASRGAVIFDANLKKNFRSGFEEHLDEHRDKAIPRVRKTEREQIEAHLLKNGTLIQAGSLEELAEKIKVPYPNLETAITDYNHSLSDFCWEGVKPRSTGDPAKIDTPPFYAEAVEGRLNCTLGGIKISPEAAVLNREDRPISGLYAAGEIMGGFYYDNYQVITGYLPVCMVFGRIAGAAAGKTLR